MAISWPSTFTVANLCGGGGGNFAKIAQAREMKSSLMVNGVYLFAPTFANLSALASRKPHFHAGLVLDRA
jgi:hypothetical protein